MKNNILILIMGILICSHFTVLQGQSSILEKYIKVGLKNNLTVQTQQLKTIQQAAVVQEAKGLNLPTVSFNANYSLAAGGRTLDFPVGDLLNPVYGALLDITGNPGFGTTVDNVNVTFLPHNFQETKLRIQQSLFNKDIKHNYQAQKQLLALENLRQTTSEADLIKDIKLAYYQYLQTLKVLDIYEAAEQLLQEVLRVNKSLVKNGKVTKDAVFEAQFELDQLAQQQATARKNQQAAQAYFNYLLQRDLTAAIEVDNTLQRSPLKASLAHLQKESSAKRTELQQLDIATAANQEKVALYQDKKYPTAYAVVDVGMQGTGYHPQNQGFVFAQIGLQWDLFTGFQNREKEQQAAIEGQIISKQKEDLQQKIKLQIHQLYYEVEAALAAIEAAQSGVRNAEQRFNIINKRYRQQQANLLQLMDARTDLTTAQIQVAISEYAVLIKEAELMWASGF